MTPPPLLDTNVLLRHLTGDHASSSPRATAVIRAIEEGRQQVRVTDHALFEAAYTLQRTYKASKREVTSALWPFVELPGVILPGKEIWRQVFALFESTRLSVVDAYQAALMHV